MKSLLTLATITALSLAAGCDNNDDATPAVRGAGANTTINDTPSNVANTEAQQAGQRSAANGDITTNTVRTDTTDAAAPTTNTTPNSAAARPTTRPAAH